MASPYTVWPGLKSHPLGRQALSLREAYGKPSRLSPLIAMSDPERTPNILKWAENLPPNCAVIYRFEAFDSAIFEGLQHITNVNGQQLLLRQKEIDMRADGLHFKRLTELNYIRRIRQDNPQALLTLAALKDGKYNSPLPQLDGLLVSSVFPSQSPSAGTPIGVEHLKDKVRTLRAPVFALGGVTEITIRQLVGTGVAGIAVVGAFA